MFEPRYRTFEPETYPDVKLPIWVNPTNKQLIDLYRGPVVDGDDDGREAFGQLIVQAYRGAKIDVQGVTLDFSSPLAALATLENETLPDDLRYWLRNAPMEAIVREREFLVKNLKAS